MVASTSLNPARSSDEAFERLGIDKLSEDDHISMAGMIGASRSHISVASCPKNKDPHDKRNIHVATTGVFCKNQLDTVRTILDIFGLLAGKGLELASFNFAGFPAQADPSKAQEIAGTQIADIAPGLHAVRNIDLSDENGLTPLYPGSNHLMNVIEELAERAPGRKLIYSDSEHPPSRPYIVGKGPELTVNAANDTVRTMVGAMCSPNDLHIDRLIRSNNVSLIGGLLNGAGFGFGLGRSYNPKEVRFNEVRNDELAWEKLPEHLLGPLDKFDGDTSPVRAETCFAGGRYGALELDELYGIRREIAIFFNRLKPRQGEEREELLEEIASYYNKVAEENKLGYKFTVDDIKRSRLFHAFQEGLETGEFAVMSNRKLMNLVADSLEQEAYEANGDPRDRFVHVMFVSLFARQAQFLAERYMEEFSEMKAIAVAGSYAIDALDRIKAVREAFMRPLIKLNPDLHLFLHALHGNDGLDNMAVNLLQMAAGLEPTRDHNGNKVKPGKLLAKFWNWIKSLLGK